MKKIGIQMVLILAIAALCAGVANTVHPKRIPWVQDWSHHVETKARKEKMKVISFHVAMEAFTAGSHLFVDARPEEEFAEGHIPGAISLPFEAIDDRFEEIGEVLDAKKPLVIYCKGLDCDDSLLLAVELRDMGAEELMLYVDGFDLWKQVGAPIEQKEAL